MITEGAALCAVAAGIAVGGAGLGSGIGTGVSGSMGARIVAKDSSKFSKALMLQALPQTQGIYGLLVAVLIIVKTGVISGTSEVPLAAGLACLGAGIAVGFAGFSAIGQGIASGSGIISLSEKEENLGKSMVFSILPETQAIYGLLIAILILYFSGVMGGELLESVPVGLGCIGAGIAVGVTKLSAMGQGTACSSAIAAVSEKNEMFGKGMVFSVLPETQAIYGLLIAILILYFTGLLSGSIEEIPLGIGIACVGAGLSIGVAGLSGIGQGIAAGSGVAAVTEKDEMFGKGMVFSVLPETQAIYGLLIAILILYFTGLLSGSLEEIPLSIGIAAIGAGIAIGVAGLSAIGQGIAAGSGIAAVTEKDEMFGKGMVFSVLPETQAIYGLLIAILILYFTGLLSGSLEEIPLSIGIAAIGAGIAIGVAGLSGIGQGIVASSSIAAVSERNEMFGKGMIFSILPETHAISALLISILILQSTGLLSGEFLSIPLSVGIACAGAGIAVGIAALSAIGQGVVAGSSVNCMVEDDDMFGKGMVFSALPQTQVIYGLLISILILYFTGLLSGDIRDMPIGIGIACVGAGLSIGVAGLSGIGQGIAAGSGVAAVTEKDEMFGKGMVFSVLPETQAIYGLLIAILILYFTGLLSGSLEEIPLSIGIAAIGAGIAIGVAGLSGIGQGIVASSSIAAVSERNEMFGKGMIFSILPETHAISALLISILILQSTGLLSGEFLSMPLSVGIACAGAGIAVGIAALSAIGQGVVAGSSVNCMVEDDDMFGKGMVFSALPQTQVIYGLLISILILYFTGLLSGDIRDMPIGIGIATVGAGVAIGLAGLSGIGQGIAAGSGVAAVTEKDEMFGKGLVFSVLPETQAIYGLLIAILILYFTGLLSGSLEEMPLGIGIACVGAGFAAGISGLSAIGQGITAGGSITATGENSKAFSKGMIFSVMSETFAIFGLLIAILILYGLNLFG
ncbi:MAG: hypothetical protein U9N35_01765 [Euryarchaeota archaeon]|nr:hypothetical protein [Euryarchaeota archaeon]